MIEDHVLKLVLGPKFKDNKHLADKRAEYASGLLDEYNCFIYIPPIPQAGGDDNKDFFGKQFSYIKVRDIKKYMFEVYTDELFGRIDIEEFVRSEIESKAIVVIDEIDKLVRTVSLSKTKDHNSNLARQLKLNQGK